MNATKSLGSFLSSNNTQNYILTLAITLFGLGFVGTLRPSHSFQLIQENSIMRSPFIGGSLIGFSAALYMLLKGKVLGFSGVFKGLVDSESSDKFDRLSLLAGVITSAAVLHIMFPLPATLFRPFWVIVAGSFAMGIGTAMANGCTSGHGICGISRFSVRSVVATATFMVTCMATTSMLYLLTRSSWNW